MRSESRKGVVEGGWVAMLVLRDTFSPPKRAGVNHAAPRSGTEVQREKDRS